MQTNVGTDGNPTNVRQRMNMFEEEEVLSEKEKMRQQLANDKEGMKIAIKNMTPEEIFILFDEDESGLIDFEEFRKMLPFLDININPAKALRYFRICDTDGSGEIDIDEFKVALFLCDPTNGNPVGYSPSSYLTPLDAFETFDEDLSGFLDEDEFFYALEYLSIPITDGMAEKVFEGLDYDKSGSIDFDEFREAFLQVCDLRAELEQRGVDVPAFTGKKTMAKMLREVLIEAEKKERLAIAESKRYKKWILACRIKRRVIQKAYFRAYQELRACLDFGGHVYVFGGGTNNQFNQDPGLKLQSKNFKFENFERVIEVWKDRVQPQQLLDRLRLERRAEEQEAQRDAERELGGLALIGKLNERKVIIDPYVEAQTSLFNGINVAFNTAALWGRRVHHVAVSESVMFALTDTGEVYTWGGQSHWWHEIQPDSLYQKKWRGETTPRSQLLLGTIEKQLPMDISVEALSLDKMSPEDRRAEVIKVVTKYFNCWEPPPNPATRMHYLEKELLPKVSYEDIQFALRCRGKTMIDVTKMVLCEELHGDILLEKKLLGERAHKSIRELEQQVAGLIRRKKQNLADKVMKRIVDMWAPLREVQAEHRALAIAKQLAEEHSEAVKLEESYLGWRSRIVQKREELAPELTPRGNSLYLNLSGVTPRGPELKTPRGFQAAIQVAAGTAHACLVHKTGQLYTWGMGAAGRLGLDLTEAGDPQRDTVQPRLVQALSGRPVIRVSCGYAHTGAIAAGGELFMWGSTASGKCGLGKIVDVEECYCSVPTKVMIGADDRRIRKLSCGSAHSAVVTEAGQVYVFGCGDGGRLGLGLGRYATVYTPVLVESLQEYRISSVSCGNTTTLACSEVKHEWVGREGEKVRNLRGGLLFMAGSRVVLGKQCDSFSLVTELENVAIKQASAGYQHNVVVSAEGEVYSWGRNKAGCCGISHKIPFIEKPTLVECLFSLPKNIAQGCRAYQCSTFNKRDAAFAVDGDTDGNGIMKSSCTHQDSQAWLEIDLGQLCVVESIKVWNRTDVPKDAFQSRDMYTSRLFPCWVMVGQDPFEPDTSPFSLKNNLRKAVAKVRFADDQRVSHWRLPANCQVQFVRVQLEGFNTLSLAQVEVFGHMGICKSVGRISYAQAGRNVTVAVVRPSSDPRDVETAYKRAAFADAANADVLRQLETYALEYDKYGRGDVLMAEGKCAICKGREKCEVCNMYEVYKDELVNMMPAVGGRRRRLKSIDGFLVNLSKPGLELTDYVRKKRPTKWQLRWQAVKRFFSSRARAKHRKAHRDITTEDALHAEPDEIMGALQDMNEGEETHDVKLDKIFNKAEQKKLKLQAEIERVENTQFNKFRKGDGKTVIDGQVAVAGETLDSGHVVKTGYLKNMEKPADMSYEILQIQKERQTSVSGGK